MPISLLMEERKRKRRNSGLTLFLCVPVLDPSSLLIDSAALAGLDMTF